ncbi:MAG: ABC transporter permease [Microthrixaceae bacterium]
MRMVLAAIMREHRRILLALVAVALGVAYLAGALSLLQRVGTGLAAQVGADVEPADLVIEGSVADDGPMQQVRRLVPDSLTAALLQVPGVRAVQPRVASDSILIIGPNGRPVVPLGLTQRPSGGNFPTVPELNPYRFVGSGTAPVGERQIVIDSTTARSTGLSVGDQVSVVAKGDPTSFTITGIVVPLGGPLPAGSSLGLFDTPTARTMFMTGPDDNAIAVQVDDGADVDAVRQRIARILPPGAEVATGEEYSAHRRISVERSFTMVRALLVGFAVLALVIGTFTVANSMALLFDHRRRSFAMLRLVGAAPRQLFGGAAVEALAGGIAAARWAWRSGWGSAR